MSSLPPAPPRPGTGFDLTLPRALAVLLAGVLFGFGLAASTMVQPQVVLSFLRLEDLGLMLVMGGGVAVIALAFALAPRLLRQPLLGGHFERHTAAWNRDTVWGSALFGIGWGLSGVCPGPAIAAMGLGQWDLLWSLLGLFIGAGLQGWQANRRSA